MTKAEKLLILDHAYINKPVEDERKEITIMNDQLSKDVKEQLYDIQHKLNEETGTFELDYDIMKDACDAVSECPTDELESYEFYGMESASVYTGTRLSYITVNNQSEISDKMREYGAGVDIADAAAAWYDDMVAKACDMLRDWVLDESK